MSRFTEPYDPWGPNWLLLTVGSWVLMLVVEVVGVAIGWWRRRRERYVRLRPAGRSDILPKTSRASRFRQWWDKPPYLAP